MRMAERVFSVQWHWNVPSVGTTVRSGSLDPREEQSTVAMPGAMRTILYHSVFFFWSSSLSPWSPLLGSLVSLTHLQSFTLLIFLFLLVFLEIYVAYRIRSYGHMYTVSKKSRLKTWASAKNTWVSMGKKISGKNFHENSSSLVVFYHFITKKYPIFISNCWLFIRAESSGEKITVNLTVHFWAFLFSIWLFKFDIIDHDRSWRCLFLTCNFFSEPEP